MAKKSLEDIDRLYEYDIFLPTRTLYIGSCSADWDGNDSGVDFVMAERAIKGLHILDSLPPVETGITILMNNPGGDYYHGQAIFDAIKGCKNHVTMRATGYVMSMGAVILQAADARVMTPTAKMMVHYGFAGCGQLHAKQFHSWADESKRLSTWMRDLFLEKVREKQPTYSPEQIDRLLDFDTYLTAQEAVALGLADRVE